MNDIIVNNNERYKTLTESVKPRLPEYRKIGSFFR